MELRKYDVNQVLFDQLLEKYSGDILLVNHIDQYKSGYKNTDLDNQRCKIAYDGKEYLIIREFWLLKTVDLPVDDSMMWKQVIVRKVDNQIDLIEAGATGTYSWNFIMKILKKSYTKDEIEECLKMHEAEYDPNNIQAHIICSIPNELMVFNNTYKYDINGAHCAALIEIFPKAKEDILNLYNARHEHPRYKAFVNYFVGYLCKRGHRKTYNWIVQRTNQILQKAMQYVGGHIIYANTDGFIVRNPARELPTSKELGDFKLEYKGQTRFYQHTNWYAYEIDTNDEAKRITGNIRLSVRHMINLKEHKIVDYTRELVHLGNIDMFETKNIKQILLESEVIL